MGHSPIKKKLSWKEIKAIHKRTFDRVGFGTHPDSTKCKKVSFDDVTSGRISREKWSKHRLRKQTYKTLRLIHENADIGPETKFASVGGGFGYTEVAIQNAYNPKVVVMSDKSEVVIPHARDVFIKSGAKKGWEVIQYDATKMPPRGCRDFDVVLSENAGSINRKEYKKALRVLKALGQNNPNTKYFLTVPRRTEKGQPALPHGKFEGEAKRYFKRAYKNVGEDWDRNKKGGQIKGQLRTYILTHKG